MARIEDKPKEALKGEDLVVDKVPETNSIAQEVAPAKNDEIPVEDAIATLKKQLEDEKSARANAEKRAAEAARTAFQAKTEVADTNLHLVTNAIDVVKENQKSLKSAYAQAMATGNFDAAAEIQEQMQSNAVKLSRLEEGKTQMESAPKPQPPVVDPVEAMAQRVGGNTRSAAWIRAHPECATNPRMFNKMIAAHNLAVADGIPSDSDEYFEFVERTVGYQGRRAAQEPQDDDPMAHSAQVVSRRSSPAAAPVSRSPMNGEGRTQVRGFRLTAVEKEAAEIAHMTEEEYWNAKQADIAESRRTTH